MMSTLIEPNSYTDGETPDNRHMRDLAGTGSPSERAKVSTTSDELSNVAKAPNVLRIQENPKNVPDMTIAEISLTRSSTAPESVTRTHSASDFALSNSSTEEEVSRSISGARRVHGDAGYRMASESKHPEKRNAVFGKDVNIDDSVLAVSAPAPDSSPAVRRFFHYVMGTDADLEGRMDEELDEAYSIAPKRRGIYNLVLVPTRLERLLVLCICVCADEFLFLFTMLPVRCAVGIMRQVVAVARWLRSSVQTSSQDPRVAGYKPIFLGQCRQHHVTTCIDLLHLSILVLTSIVLSSFDISWVYHSIRGQSFIKLYVVFNVMEIFDRLCCSFGVDILDSLGWTTASAVNFFLNRPNSGASHGRHGDGAGIAILRARAFRGFSLLTRVLVDYVITFVYVCVHATLLLAWVVTLNVAINTQNNALLTLLVSNNFVELKGAVFKSFKVQNLFQIACSDGVERFQLTVFLGVMLGYAEGDMRLLVTWLIMFLSEVIVDWIKHAFVTKFNRIPHRAYQQFSMVICRDIVQSKRNSAVRSIGGSGVAKRIGFVSLPLGALTLRMASHGLMQAPPAVPVLLFFIMLTTKIALSIGLLGHAYRRFKPQSGRDGENFSGILDEDEAWLRTLAHVGRYDKL